MCVHGPLVTGYRPRLVYTAVAATTKGVTVHLDRKAVACGMHAQRRSQSIRASSTALEFSSAVFVVVYHQ